MDHNLPFRLTSFVGREREMSEVGTLVRRERLVTLVGAPGVGKTRLALQIASRALDQFADGVWLVELAPLSDPTLVPQAVAQVLDVREQPGRRLTATLADALRAWQTLLLLDNCEHLIEAAATLADTVLQACPRLHILATSREPLAVDGEIVQRVPSLTVPGTIGPQIGRNVAVALADSEAVHLFVERAKASAASFMLTDVNAPLIAQICTRLDGIPLAIELAAARVQALSVEQIAARLDDRFRLLTGGARTALPRQRTLRAAVDWSYDLLSEPEQTLLRRLSVFAGGFTLDAAEAVASSELRVTSKASQLATRYSLLDLVDKSLIQVDEAGDDERRYRLLETFRQYGQEKLIEYDELTAARDRHRDYFLALAEDLAPTLNERSNSTVLSRIEREHDNLRAALGWCLDEVDAERVGRGPDGADRARPGAVLGVRIAAAIWRFWWLRGHLGEGQRWLARVLAVSPAETGPDGLSARAMAYLGLANLSAFQGDYRAAVTHMTENLAFCRETGNDRGVANALQRLGFYLAHLNEPERGARLCEESIALARQLGHLPTLAAALNGSAIVAMILARYEQSIALAQESIDLHRQLGNVTVAAYGMRTQGVCYARLGDLTRATQLAEEGLRISLEGGDRRGIGASYKDLALCALLTGDVGRAIELLRIGIPIFHEMGDRWLGGICISLLARARIEQGGARISIADGVGTVEQAEAARAYLLEAVRLVAATDLLRERDGLGLPVDLHGVYDRDLSLLRERLGHAAFSQAWAEGRALSFVQLVEYALAITAPSAVDRAAAGADTPGPAGAPDQAPPGDREAARLTPREREVAELVAQGLTNRQIAETLVLSERTIDSHIRGIMGKLEVSSRARIAAWAVQHGLAGPR